MTEDTAPVAVELASEKPKSRKRILAIGVILLLILLLLNSKTIRVFITESFTTGGAFGANDSGKKIQEIIEIGEPRTVPFKLTAVERYVNLNFTVSTVTKGNITTILATSNESLKTWKKLVETFNKNRGVESTEFKFVYSAQYGYRKYYFWWHNGTLFAIDATNLEKSLLKTIIAESPPTEDLF